MTSTVVMSTYNGETYLVEQLTSLLNQSRKPDVVIIHDDGSNDKTVDIVNEFISSNGLESTWNIVENSSNKGCTLNFVDAAAEVSTDVVFYCDQDDIWEPAKIELMMNGFEVISDMLACYCLRTYIDANGRQMRQRFEGLTNVPVRNKGFQKVSVAEAVKYNKSPGLCLALKQSLAKELRPFIIEYGLTHDLPVGTVAAIKGAYYVLNERLVRYRIHGSNISSPRITVSDRVNNKELQIKGRIQRYQQMDAILRQYGKLLSKRDYECLSKAVVSTAESIEYLEAGRVDKLIIQCLQSNPMINPWISINNLLTAIH